MRAHTHTHTMSAGAQKEGWAAVKCFFGGRSFGPVQTLMEILTSDDAATQLW